MRYATIFLTIFAAAVPPARAQDVTARIKQAQYALGMIRGPQRIDAINTMEYWGSGTAGRPAGKVSYHVSLSYFTPAMRVDVTREPGGRQIQVVNGSFAWDESVPGAGFIPGTTARPAPAAVKDRLLQLWSTPYGALKAAERAASSVTVTNENGATVLGFPMTLAPLTGITMKVTLNPNNHVVKVETRTENGTVTETTYSDYKDLGEIQSDVLFPSHIAQKQGGVPVLDLTITKADPINPYVVFPIPENVEKLR